MRVQVLGPLLDRASSTRPSNAALAAALTASSTSAAVPAGIVAMTVLGDESNTSIVSVPAEATHAPLM